MLMKMVIPNPRVGGGGGLGIPLNFWWGCVDGSPNPDTICNFVVPFFLPDL